MSKTFCILPWIHLSTRPNGHARVCCTANASSVGATNDKKHGGEIGIVKNDDGKPANFNTASLKEALNNDYMRSTRVAMMNDEIPPQCQKCFTEEEAGHRSKRVWETAYWAKQGYTEASVIPNTTEDGTIEPKLPYIDLRFGSKCNLACIMCSPHDSSKWVPDWNKLFPKIENPELKELMQWSNKGTNDGASYNWHMNNPKFWEELYEQIPHMQQLYFAGGEPLIIDAHYDLLEKCIEDGSAEHITLRYNSNGMEWRDDLFDLWKHFKLVRYHYSIDSVYEMNDYIRYPSKWDHMVEQFKVLDKSPDNVEVTIACAVQALNIYYVPDLIKWKLEQDFKKINPWPLGAGLVNFHFVYHPAHLNVKILPQWFKDEVEQKYEAFYEWLDENWELSGATDKKSFMESGYGIERLKGMVSFMQSEDWSRRVPQLVEYVNKMDAIRGTDFSEVFPEMARILNEN